MATYDYTCNGCSTTYSVERAMNDDSLAPVCTDCHTTMSRLWSSPTVVFNGKGFYSTGG